MINKILVGFFTGLTVGYTIGKCQEKKFFDGIYRNMNVYRLKRKNDYKMSMNTKK